MAYPTFTPPGLVRVDVGSSISVKPRVRRADFGDGYSQRSGDGLNALGRKVEINFTNLELSEGKTIEAFFEERAGYKPFLWTFPHETTPRQWICTEWRKNLSAPRTYSVSAAFEETFDP
jgi:phage-related protein